MRNNQENQQLAWIGGLRPFRILQSLPESGVWRLRPSAADVK